jgi:hypothetical protein
MTPPDEAAALRALQDDIYRERILRARRMTPEQRLSDVIELTNGVFARMHEGAMWQLGTTDAEAGWREVARRLARLSATDERGRFAPSRPA